MAVTVKGKVAKGFNSPKCPERYPVYEGVTPEAVFMLVAREGGVIISTAGP